MKRGRPKSIKRTKKRRVSSLNPKQRAAARARAFTRRRKGR